MLHIFIPETTPEEKQRKLLRFEEKDENVYLGYGGANPSTTEYSLDLKPLFNNTSGYVQMYDSLMGGMGTGGWIWGNTAFDHANLGSEIAYSRLDVKPSVINERHHGFSLRYQWHNGEKTRTNYYSYQTP